MFGQVDINVDTKFCLLYNLDPETRILIIHMIKKPNKQSLVVVRFKKETKKKTDLFIIFWAISFFHTNFSIEDAKFSEINTSK